ncbi:MAG: YdcF family protein [Bacteroidota bacterium]|nr:YdcF family protein [Bacteroidota bacterium]
MNKIFRIFLQIVLVLVLIPVTGLIAIFLNYHLISLSVSGKIYDNPQEISFRKYTLVMGGGNFRPGLWVNHTFNHRMQATAELYKDNKTDKIIASGALTTSELDEVGDMKLVLLEYGIPEADIIIDYEGIRTWASVERTFNYHNADTIIIVSQCDQLERALFIARCIGLDAIGMRAEPTPTRRRAWTIREYLARVKCTLDCIAYKFSFT